MKTFTQTKQLDNTFEDLEDDTFRNMKWNPSFVNKIATKGNPKIKRMRSR